VEGPDATGDPVDVSDAVEDDDDGGMAVCETRNEEALIFIGDFETGDMTGFHPSGNSPAVTTSPVRFGNYSMRSSLERWVDPVSYRTEAVPDDQDTHVGDELWYGISIFLPDEYVADPIWELVTQWHGRPDFDIGEDWRNPIMALFSEDGEWLLNVIWDSKENTFESGERVYDGSESFDLGPHERGRWTDWVFHIMWSYEDDGILQVWKNGELVVDRVGPNAFNDAQGPYLKFGIYKGWKDPETVGEVDSRLLFHDELRIGGPDAVYCDVAPGH